MRDLDALHTSGRGCSPQVNRAQESNSGQLCRSKTLLVPYGAKLRGWQMFTIEYPTLCPIPTRRGFPSSASVYFWLGFARYVSVLLARLAIIDPLSARFQTEASHEPVGLCQRSWLTIPPVPSQSPIPAQPEFAYVLPGLEGMSLGFLPDLQYSIHSV